MSTDTDTNGEIPLYKILGEIVAVWTLANIGYYLVFPAFGFSLSYNSSPVAIAVYFALWVVFTLWYFKDIYKRGVETHPRLWLYVLLSFGLGILLWIELYLFSFMPSLHGPLISTFTDIVLASPWYFLPKSVEILVQQLLVAVLVLELYFRFNSVKKVLIGYVVCFGGAHIVLFLLNKAPLPYALAMTCGAFVSSLIFPYLILKVRGGFVYAYAIHFFFYILLAVLLHVWPPAGYVI